MHDMELPESLLAIARAGAGVNNIPVDKCSEQGVVVFNTPGANANAVKELVLCGLLLASRKVVAGHGLGQDPEGPGGRRWPSWWKRARASLPGPEIQGKTLGVIGLGAIGILVANAARLPGHGCLRLRPLPLRGSRLAPVQRRCTAPCPWMRSTRTATTSPCTCPSPPTPRAWWTPKPSRR